MKLDDLTNSSLLCILGKVYTGRVDCGKWLRSGLTHQGQRGEGIVGRNLGRQV